MPDEEVSEAMIDAKKIFMIAPNFYGIDISIKSAFESLGFEVILKNTRNRLKPAESCLLKMTKIVPAASGAFRPFFRSFLDRDNEEYLYLMREARPDIFFTVKGETIYPETLLAIKREMKIPCIIYLWDSPFFSYSGHVVDIDRRTNFINGMHLYDHIFCHDPYYVRELKSMGAKNVSYLPLATDPAQYREIALSEADKSEFGYDVCFVGSPLPNRIEILEGFREFKLGVFGDGWDLWHRLKLKKIPYYYKGTAAGEKALKVYCSSKIVLNIHSPEAKDGVNTRTFDIPSCGAFQLADYRPEMDRLFLPGEEIVYYRDIDELKRLAKFFLENPKRRQSIAEKGRAKVLGSHTWRHRVKEMMTLVPKNVLMRS